ncbi:MAG: carboxypeptidase-like regulatory domain-containing protein [Methanobrevibacter sp.]|uniref:carboxypeptidase-like regulatory domain-containing protein n=1 Tax=Methanobrevibacter sp. TaxID=66852 RepID=UPI002E763414|nr:carboxypeptidase-like regulatory domain-containing protein [Methanobrevibacter sp.]MEE0943407.1 carboxypeptidase-like regulatory domain-containing protein [Methanobrevibacter sp.]
MESKNIIIILIVIIVILAAAIGFMVLKPMHAKEPTKIKVDSNKTLYEGDNLSVKLTDLNKTPLSKQNVNITVKDSKGKVVTNKTVKTNSKGKAKLDLNLKKGKYNVSVSYGGNENYTGNNTTQKLMVKEKEKVAESQPTHSTDTYIERTEGNLKYGYKDGRYGFWTPSGNFIEDKSRAISGEDPKEPFMRDGDFYSQL